MLREDKWDYTAVDEKQSAEGLKGQEGGKRKEQGHTKTVRGQPSPWERPRKYGCLLTTMGKRHGREGLKWRAAEFLGHSGSLCKESQTGEKRSHNGLKNWKPKKAPRNTSTTHWRRVQITLLGRTHPTWDYKGNPGQGLKGKWRQTSIVLIKKKKKWLPKATN